MEATIKTTAAQKQLSFDSNSSNITITGTAAILDRVRILGKFNNFVSEDIKKHPLIKETFGLYKN
jgi:hypothetical protein